MFEVGEDLLIVSPTLGTDAFECVVGVVQADDECSAPRVLMCGEHDQILGAGLAPGCRLDHGLETRTIDIDGDVDDRVGRDGGRPEVGLGCWIELRIVLGHGIP